MENPHKFHVAFREFLNLPGYQAGAYIRAEVGDTSDAEVRLPTRQLREGEDLHVQHYVNYTPMTLQIADCTRHIDLEFDISSADARANTFHKVDTLLAGVTAFREGLILAAKNQREKEAEVLEKYTAKFGDAKRPLTRAELARKAADDYI